MELGKPISMSQVWMEVNLREIDVSSCTRECHRFFSMLFRTFEFALLNFWFQRNVVIESGNLQHPLGKEHVQLVNQCHILSLILHKILESPLFVSQIHLSSGICTSGVVQFLPWLLLPVPIQNFPISERRKPRLSEKSRQQDHQIDYITEPVNFW